MVRKVSEAFEKRAPGAVNFPLNLTCPLMTGISLTQMLLERLGIMILLALLRVAKTLNVNYV